jgi:hypothetical protein
LFGITIRIQHAFDWQRTCFHHWNKWIVRNLVMKLQSCQKLNSSRMKFLSLFDFCQSSTVTLSSGNTHCLWCHWHVVCFFQIWPVLPRMSSEDWD